MNYILHAAAGDGKIKLPEDADIRKMLLPGETLLWQGQPEEGAHWHFSFETAAFLIVGTVMLLVSGSFFTVVALSDAPIFFFLFSLPFFLVGVIFIAFVILFPLFRGQAAGKVSLRCDRPANFINEFKKSFRVSNPGACGLERKDLPGWPRNHLHGTQMAQQADDSLYF